MKMNRTTLVRIIAVVLVVAAVAVIWYVKNTSRKTTETAKMDDTPAASLPSEIPATSSDLLITTPLDLAALRASELPVLIDFGADTCIPCKAMAPVLEELNRTLQGKAIIRFVDVWKYKELSAGIPLQVIPTQILFDSTGKPFVPNASMNIEFIQYSDKTTNEHVFTVHEGGLTKDDMLTLLSAMGMKK